MRLRASLGEAVAFELNIARQIIRCFEPRQPFRPPNVNLWQRHLGIIKSGQCNINLIMKSFVG